MKYLVGFLTGLGLLLLHVALVMAVYQPGVPNGDLGLLLLPNIFIPAFFLGLFHVPREVMFGLGQHSILIWTGIFWFLIGAALGWIIAYIVSRKMKSLPRA